MGEAGRFMPERMQETEIGSDVVQFNVVRNNVALETGRKRFRESGISINLQKVWSREDVNVGDILPLAVITQAVRVSVDETRRMSLLVWPFRKRTRSAPVSRSFARDERSQTPPGV